MTEPLPGRIRVYCDLGHPESTRRIIVGFEDCTATPYIGDTLNAVDLSDRREAAAECVGLDERGRTVSIAVDWSTCREVTA